jgi:hypothetical protein
LQLQSESDEFMAPMTACAEFFFYPRGASISDPKSSSTEATEEGVNHFVKISTPIVVLIHNSFDFPLDIWWSEEDAGVRRDGHVEANSTIEMGSFLGHVFSFTKAKVLSRRQMRARRSQAMHEDVLDYWAVDGSEYTVSSKNRLETCGNNDGSGLGEFTTQTFIACDDMMARFKEFEHMTHFDKRKGNNFVQPQIVRAVTKSGFEHRQLPYYTYAWLREWFLSSRGVGRNSITESHVGPCMNQHTAPSEMTHLPYDGEYSKKRLSEELQDVLEDWYGGPLTMTSIYGIRRYTNNSILRMHVDTVFTHVVSAIINVDQKVDRDWKLKILDHDYNEHEMVMKPGDLVLYESAKLLHGRPDTFSGEHYDNIFIHYAPVESGKGTGVWDYDWL